MAKVGIDFERLLRLRLLVARYGEMDLMRWWNTKGQLGPTGTIALRRGFPRTHRFAAAGSVFAVARHRCAELLNRPKSITLWSLPSAIEEDLDACWEWWCDHASDWEAYFVGLEKPSALDLLEALVDRDLVTPKQVAAVQRLTSFSKGHAVEFPKTFRPNNAGIAMLAAAFALGKQGALTVPYARAA